MSTRLTYTSGDLGAETDAAFEEALEAARGSEADPHPHLIAGEGGLGAWYLPQFMREQSRTIVE